MSSFLTDRRYIILWEERRGRNKKKGRDGLTYGKSTADVTAHFEKTFPKKRVTSCWVAGPHDD